MNNTRIEIALTAGMVLLTTACSGGGSGGSTTVQRSAAEGDWVQTCMLNAEDNDYEKSTLLIADNNFTMTQTSYTDAACTQPEQQATVEGTFTEMGPITADDNLDATALDLTFDSLALAFFTSDLVDSANGVALCGSTGWAAGVSRDVGNCTDVPDSDVPRQVYNIYRRDGDSLLTSAEGSDMAATRPTAIDAGHPYTLATTAGPVDEPNDDPVNGPVDEPNDDPVNGPVDEPNDDPVNGPVDEPNDDPVNGPVDEPNDDPVNGPGGTPTLPEASLALTAGNGAEVAQFVMSHFALIKNTTMVSNAAVLRNTGITDATMADFTMNSFCPGGGSVSLNGTPGILVTLTSVYDDCVAGNSRFNGSMTMTFNSVFGPFGDISGTWGYSTAINVQNLMVEHEGRELAMTGDFILTLVHMADTEQAGGMTVRFQGTQGEQLMWSNSGTVTRMIDFDFIFIVSRTNPVIFSDTFDEARLASTDINGQITVEETIPFSGFALSTPDTGGVEIFGKFPSMAEVDVTDLEAVTITVDAEGDDDFSGPNDLVFDTVWTGFFNY